MVDTNAFLDAPIGHSFDAVQFLLLCDREDESANPAREAVEFRFGPHRLTICAVTDTSELSISTDPIPHIDDADYQTVDGTGDPRLAPFIGKALRNWWLLTNDGGYSDGLMLAFASDLALLMVAMNNVVSLLHVSGDQCS